MRTAPLNSNDPTSVGPWRLVARVGAGGMGVVFLGQRTTGGRTQQAAVKLISSDLVGRDVAVARFRREIAVLMSLDDPGVARVIAADLEEEPPWYAADLIDGKTLASQVEDDGPIAPDLWPSLALSLASTLTRVHDRRIIHRDLKPHNVVLGRSGPVIIDFGISAVLGATSLTESGASPRTELWASPEQLRNEGASAASDIFALGTLLAWAGTGRHPFAAETGPHRDGVYAAILSSAPNLDGLPGDAVQWLTPMLAKEPSERPTAVELVESILDVDPEAAGGHARQAQASGWSAAARSWWRVAADAGDSEAYVELGRLAAADGDRQAARSWWLMAQAVGHPEASLLLADDSGGQRQAGPASRAATTLVSDAVEHGPTWRTDGPDSAAPPAPREQRPRRWLRPRRVLALSAGTVAALLLAWLTSSLVRGPADVATPDSYSTLPQRVAHAIDEAGGGKATRIAVGDTSACMITNGRVRCWGSNSSGQLGSPGADSDTPRDVDASDHLKGVVLDRVVVGNVHACALDVDGRMYCWGSNSHGQLGVGAGEISASSTPLPVGGPAVEDRTFALIGAAGASTCALDSEGLLFCWGDNATGQVGDGFTVQRDTPVPVDATGVLQGRRVDRFAVGGDHTCAMDTTHSLSCWGANDRGQLGDGTLRASLVPRPVASTEAVSQGQYANVNLGEAVTCAVTLQGTAACWGANDQGQLGIGAAKQDMTVPQPVAASGSALPFDRLAVSGPTVCSTSEARIVFCWGDNSSGQLGSGTTQDASIPAPVADPEDGPLPPFGLIAAGPTTSCAVDLDGRAWCWGSNLNGMLGVGVTPPAQSLAGLAVQR